ncbi:hypothetical protein MRGR3_1934 [Staphylococcus aureus subsp. aureus MRGR3]|nr:hypothetical protein MRGR3_1934 [Staphylococcus aureus subsp. aureus MRGR3]
MNNEVIYMDELIILLADLVIEEINHADD